jgi:hypothetical protein
MGTGPNFTYAGLATSANPSKAILGVYCSFAYSAFAAMRIGMSGSASIQRMRNPDWPPWPSGLLNRELFLAQKVKVGVTAGTSINDGGKVLGKIVGVTAKSPGKNKWDP